MGFLGCYDGFLHCDEPTCQETYESSDYATYGGFIAEARRWGWLYNLKGKPVHQGTGHCLCPKHSGKVKK